MTENPVAELIEATVKAVDADAEAAADAGAADRADRADGVADGGPPSAPSKPRAARPASLWSRLGQLSHFLLSIAALLTAVAAMVKSCDHSVTENAYATLAGGIKATAEGTEKNHEDLLALRGYLAGPADGAAPITMAALPAVSPSAAPASVRVMASAMAPAVGTVPKAGRSHPPSAARPPAAAPGDPLATAIALEAHRDAGAPYALPRPVPADGGGIAAPVTTSPATVALLAPAPMAAAQPKYILPPIHPAPTAWQPKKWDDVAKGK